MANIKHLNGMRLNKYFLFSAALTLDLTYLTICLKACAAFSVEVTQLFTDRTSSSVSVTKTKSKHPEAALALTGSKTLYAD